MLRSPSQGRSYSNPDLAAEPDAKITIRKRKKPECDSGEEFRKLASEFRDSFKRIEDKIDSKYTSLEEKFSSLHADLFSLSNNLAELKGEIAVLRTDQGNMMERINNSEKNNNVAISNLINKHAEVVKDISALQSSTEFFFAKQEDILQRTTELENAMKNSSLAPDLVSSLESKIDSLEQQARMCNIEITNVPERRSENLMKIVSTICNTIKCPIAQHDVIAVHRVPHAQQAVKRPKNIIVKFASRILRDNVMSAFRAVRVLNSDQIDISGTPQAIYLNEHLTLKNKILFRDCRDVSKRHGFKYVWVRHATILVRETDNSPIFAIRNHKDIANIKPRRISGTTGHAST